MTVAVTPPRKEYIEDGVTVVRAIPFQFFTAAELVVTRIVDNVGSQLAPSAYAVTGGNGQTGSLTLTAPGADGSTLRIERSTIRNQLVDYIAGDSFPAESHERALDRLTMIVQEDGLRYLTPEQIEDLLAAFLREGTNIELVYDDVANTLTINNLFGAEEARDTIAAALAHDSSISITVSDAGDSITLGLEAVPAELVTPHILNSIEAGAGIQLVKDPLTGKVTIVCTVQSVDQLADMLLLSGDQQDGGVNDTGQISPEVIRDVLALALVAGSGINVVVDDAANTITLEATGTGGLTLEQVQDAVAAMLVAGAGIDGFVYDDAAGTITVNVAAGGGGGLTLEDVRDAVAAFIVPGTGLAKVHDDAGDTLTLTPDIDGSYKGLAIITKNAAFTFDPAQIGRAINYTGSSANATIDPEATTALPDGFITTIRNDGAPGTILTLHRGAAVSLKANGGSVDADVQINVDEIATLQRWGADDFTVAVMAS